MLDQLARELGMSVVPVREAIRRLEAEGVVTFERNVGARVAAIDPVDYRDACQTLAIVEGAAVALAQPHLAAADLAEARAVNDRLRECLADFDPVRFTRLNEAFHRTLSDPCPNAQLKNLVDVGWLRLAGLRRSTFGFMPGRAHASVAEHDALLALLTAGRPPPTSKPPSASTGWRACAPTWTATPRGHHEHPTRAPAHPPAAPHRRPGRRLDRRRDVRRCSTR